MNADLEIVFKKNPRNQSFPGAFWVERNVLQGERERARKEGEGERERTARKPLI